MSLYVQAWAKRRILGQLQGEMLSLRNRSRKQTKMRATKRVGARGGRRAVGCEPLLSSLTLARRLGRVSSSLCVFSGWVQELEAVENLRCGWENTQETGITGIKLCSYQLGTAREQGACPLAESGVTFGCVLTPTQQQRDGYLPSPELTLCSITCCLFIPWPGDR